MSGLNAGPKKVEKGFYLFRENDPSDAMYVIKSGTITIVKTKGTSEVPLAELGPGQMFGEMAFFDNKPRSASARALTDAEVIAFPFKNLYAQFKTFPEWLKVMVKSVNQNLREANLRIKNLEKSVIEEESAFPPVRINKLITILTMVAHRFGEKDETGTSVPAGTLRRYTIQIFGEPTNKMQKMMDVLSKLEHMTVQDLGEGRQKIVIHHLELLMNLVDFYTDFLFKDESKRTPIEESELRAMKTLIFYGRKSVAAGASPKEAKIELTQAQNDSMKDLGYLFKPEDINSLCEKKVLGERMSSEAGPFIKVDLTELERLHPMWEIIHTLLKIRS